jgi:hypothetical protein
MNNMNDISDNNNNINCPNMIYFCDENFKQEFCIYDKNNKNNIENL